jgi:Flp pilus assembly pilin Flp
MSLARRARAELARWRRFQRDQSGSAAAEFVLWVGLLTLPILNAVDIGYYAFQRMQLETAAEAAVDVAWHTCGVAGLPTATCTVPGVNPPTLASTMQAAAQATSLGTGVLVPAATIVEGYYCSNGSGALVQVGASGSTTTAPTKPSGHFDCSGVVTNSTTAPGDYIQATATYTYTPLFASTSLLTLLGGTTMTRTAWLRLD